MSIFNREENNLIVIQGLDYFSASLAGIFITIYFFKNSDLKTTMFFSFISFTSTLFFYVASGWILKKISSALLIRISLIGSAIFYLTLFFLKQQSLHYLIPLGILAGFNTGNYWAGLNINQYLYTNKEKRIEYFGFVTGIINLLSAIAPLIGGFIIFSFKSFNFMGPESGYSILFFLVFLILIFMIIFAGKLPNHELINFSFKDIIFHKRSNNWKLILWQNFFLGLYDSSILAITGILFYLILKNEFSLGGTQTIAFILGTLGSMISIKLLNKNKYFYWIGSLGLAIGIGTFALLNNLNGIIVFIIVTGFCAPFLNNWLSTLYFKTMDEINVHGTEKYHLMLERDIALGIPRILSFLLLFLFLQFGNQVLLAKYSLYVVVLFPLIIGFLLNKMKKESV
ncbi:MAG: MFS transporter [bacterium]|nr:MFS transporter [bacterium]